MTPPSPSSGALDTLQQSQATPESMANVFSDAYAVEGLEEVDVVDGFDRNRAAGHDRIERLSSQPSSSATPQNQVTKSTRSRNTRSTDKSNLEISQSSAGGRLSFSLRHDGQTGNRSGRSIPPTSHQTILASSNADPFGDSSSSETTLRPRSPFHAGSGPSFPYALYPQQNTIPDPEPPLHLANAAIPVGFSDQQGTYQRRIGPDGEDIADIIGPYGHTEPLPPYSRYAGGMPRKDNENSNPSIQHPSAFGTSIPSYVSTDPRLPPLDFGLSTQPESPDQSEDVAGPPPPSAHSVRSQTSGIRLNAAGSNWAGNQGDDSLNEKRFLRENRKICGVAVSVRFAAIVVILLVILAAILGGVIGAVVSRKNGQQQSTPSTTESSPVALDNAVASTTLTATIQVTKTYDAIPMSETPTGIPPLEAGSWQLPWGPPSSGGHDCIPDDQSVAWSCKIGDFEQSQIVVDPDQDGCGKITIVNQTPPPDAFPYYGTQAPSVMSNQTLHWASDVNNQSLGPAAFFQSLYNKVVIVPGGALNASSSNHRRDEGSRYDNMDSILDVRDMSGSREVAAGDTPWYCYWNNTLVEGFIYTTQNASDASPNPSGGSSGTAYVAATGQNMTSPPPLSNGPPDHDGPPGLSPQKRDGTSQPPFFSKILKIEERRDPDWIESAPYCQQMQILNDGRAGVALDGHGNPIIVTLQEVKGTYKRREKRGIEERSPDVGWSKCHCQWMLPNP